jgi:hypothetical protein
MTARARQRAKSNNSNNTNKNICALKVAQALGVHDDTRYLHNVNDIVYAARKAYTVRSRGSNVKGKTVGASRAKLIDLAAKHNTVGFLVMVAGHVLLIDKEGRTVVDTDPRKRDKRKITHCYIVYK